MSLSTPTVAELNDAIVAQLEAAFSQTIPLLPKAFLRVLAKVNAGALVLVYRYAGFAHLQQYTATASTRETSVNGTTLIPLVEIGRRVGVGDPRPASRAELSATVTVLSQTGTLSAGTQLLRADTGVTYQTVFDVALDAATINIVVRASDDEDDNGGRGVIGNLPAGATLEFAKPIPQVASEATVTATTLTAEDAESWEAYRTRIRQHEQARPQGGAYADYREWAEEAAGVLAAYPYTGDPGEVVVYVEGVTDADGIATQAEIDAAKALIQYDADGVPNRLPVNARFNVFSITRVEFSVVIYDLEEETAKSAIEAAIDEFLRSREPYILGLSPLPRIDKITQGEVAGVVYSVTNALGTSVANVELQWEGATITTRTLGKGEKAKFGTASYV